MKKNFFIVSICLIILSIIGIYLEALTSSWGNGSIYYFFVSPIISIFIGLQLIDILKKYTKLNIKTIYFMLPIIFISLGYMSLIILGLMHYNISYNALDAIVKIFTDGFTAIIIIMFVIIIIFLIISSVLYFIEEVKNGV